MKVNDNRQNKNLLITFQLTGGCGYGFNWQKTQAWAAPILRFCF